MGRVIDEDDVMKALCRELCHPGAICPDGYCEEVRERLKDVPTADAVPVIRCKDCKYWDAFPSSSLAPEFHKCKGLGVHTVADFFCSKGERADG